jgi:curved DNA-binding protein
MLTIFMQNPYQTLGVNHNATPDDIKRAYRKLASQHHPDKGGDKTRFQEVQSAYDTLSDPQKRAQYDNPPNPFGQHGFNFTNNGGGFNFENIFNVFGAQFHNPHQQRMQQQARMSLWITLSDVAEGGRRTISVGSPQGNITVEIEIPLGINDGDTVQYPKTGPLGMDLLITFRIHPNPRWERQGPNLTIEQTVSVWDLILGSEIPVKDILGNTMSLTIPPRTQPGTVFRLRERGLRQRSGSTGDFFIRMQAKIPEYIPESIIDAIGQARDQ